MGLPHESFSFEVDRLGGFDALGKRLPCTLALADELD